MFKSIILHINELSNFCLRLIVQLLVFIPLMIHIKVHVLIFSPVIQFLNNFLEFFIKNLRLSFEIFLLPFDSSDIEWFSHNFARDWFVGISRLRKSMVLLSQIGLLFQLGWLLTHEIVSDRLFVALINIIRKPYLRSSMVLKFIHIWGFVFNLSRSWLIECTCCEHLIFVLVFNRWWSESDVTVLVPSTSLRDWWFGYSCWSCHCWFFFHSNVHISGGSISQYGFLKVLVSYWVYLDHSTLSHLHEIVLGPLFSWWRRMILILCHIIDCSFNEFILIIQTKCHLRLFFDSFYALRMVQSCGFGNLFFNRHRLRFTLRLFKLTSLVRTLIFSFDVLNILPIFLLLDSAQLLTDNWLVQLVIGCRWSDKSWCILWCSSRVACKVHILFDRRLGNIDWGVHSCVSLAFNIFLFKKII